MADVTVTGTGEDAPADPCAQSVIANYDLGLHIAAIFIIMGCSFLGTCLPILAKKIPALKIRELPFSCAKMFGSGIILSTSLVHMLTPAIENLTNPCLDQAIWGEDGYGAWAPAICVGSILVLNGIQFAVSKKLRSQLLKERTTLPETKPAEPTPATEGMPVDIPKAEGESDVRKRRNSHGHGHSHSHGHDHDGHAHGGELLFAQKEHEVSTYILELGIVSHSIIIGVALGVAVDPEFKPLLVAIVFHQFFEGIALSTVVLDTKFKGRLQSIIMVIFYTLTTPIGIAIGVGISSSYNPNSAGGLIAQGVLDAISAGILLYDVLVNIISTHTRSPYFYSCSTKSQILQLSFLYFGAFIMALVGKWA